MDYKNWTLEEQKLVSVCVISASEIHWPAFHRPMSSMNCQPRVKKPMDFYWNEICTSASSRGKLVKIHKISLRYWAII